MKTEVNRPFLLLIGVLILSAIGLECRLSGVGQPTGKRLEFQVLAMGEIVDSEGTKAGFRTVPFSKAHFGFTGFKASDGAKLTAMDGQFRSPEEAKRYFEWIVSRCPKILKRGVKTDSKGKIVGYRAEVLLGVDQKQWAVIRTNGAMFFQIVSDSLADALEFERQKGN